VPAGSVEGVSKVVRRPDRPTERREGGKNQLQGGGDHRDFRSCSLIHGGGAAAAARPGSGRRPPTGRTGRPRPATTRARPPPRGGTPRADRAARDHRPRGHRRDLEHPRPAPVRDRDRDTWRYVAFTRSPDRVTLGW
jgi:hypothetical protein